MNRWVKLILIIILMLYEKVYATPLWEIEFKVSRGNAYNRLIIGVAEDATNCHDKIYEMRALLEDTTPGIRAYFYHPEWGTESPYFWRDIRSAEFPQIWLLTIEARPQSEIFVQWDLKTFKQNQCKPLRIKLRDLYTGEEINILNEIAYSFYMDGSGKRVVEIISETANGSSNLLPPYEVSIVEAGASQNIILKWKPSPSEGIVGYNIYRSYNEDKFVKINSMPIDGLEYKDNIKESGVYSYYLTSAGVNGCESLPSDVVSIDKEVKAEKK